MRKSHNRSVITARAAQNIPARRSSLSVGQNPGARTSTIVTASGHVKKTRAMKMTGAQRNSEGRVSEWNGSTDFFTDPRWSQTVQSQNV